MCLPVSIFGQSGVDHVVKVGVVTVILMVVLVCSVRCSSREDDMSSVIEQETLWGLVCTCQASPLLVLIHKQEAPVKLV